MDENLIKHVLIKKLLYSTLTFAAALFQVRLKIMLGYFMEK